MHPWMAHLAWTCPERGRVFCDGCPSFGAVWNSLEFNHNGWYMSRVTLPHKHDDTDACANAALHTYLLNGDILLLLVRSWPLPQKRALGDRTHYSAVTPSNYSTSLTITSFDSRRHLWSWKFYWGFNSAMVTHVGSKMLFDDPAVTRRRLGGPAAPLIVNNLLGEISQPAHVWPRAKTYNNCDNCHQTGSVNLQRLLTCNRVDL